jgi:hypothetical protein
MPCTRTGIPLRSIPAGEGPDGADASRRAIGPASQSVLMRREAPAIKPDSRDAPAGHP